MAVSLQAALFALLAIFAICSSASVEYYDQTLEPREEMNVKRIVVTCRRVVNGFPNQMIVDLVWYFNGSNHMNHTCTKDAIVSDNTFELNIVPECEGYIQCGNTTELSLPLLLLSYPAQSDDGSPKSINATVGERLVVPCRMRVSSTGNFNVQWHRRSIRIPDPNITEDYNLIIENPENATYNCIVQSVDSENLLFIAGRSQISGGTTNIVVYPQFVQPGINEIRVKSNKDNNQKIITVDSIGTKSNFKYTWRKNGETLDSTVKNVTLIDVEDEDIVRVDVFNTDYDGVVNSDFAQVYFSINNTCNFTTCETPVTDNKGSGKTMMITLFVIIGLLFVIVIILIVIIIALLVKRNKHNKKTDQLAIYIGEEKITIDLTQLNTKLPEFFDKLNFALHKLKDEIYACKVDNPQLQTLLADLSASLNSWMKHHRIRFDGGKDLALNDEILAILLPSICNNNNNNDNDDDQKPKNKETKLDNQ